MLFIVLLTKTRAAIFLLKFINFEPSSVTHIITSQSLKAIGGNRELVYHIRRDKVASFLHLTECNLTREKHALSSQASKRATIQGFKRVPAPF